jgi:cytochrome c
MRALGPVLALAVLTAGLVGCATFADASYPRSPSIARGREAAQRQCARCHAIGVDGESPSARAPSFRDIRLRYAGFSLQRELEATSAVGHYAMPPTPIGAADRQDLAKYIEHLGEH